MYYLNQCKPVKFWGYTTAVRDRIFEQEYDCGANEIRNELLQIFNDAGIKCSVDNKIVFEVEIHGQTLYYGFYDCVFSIGFSHSRIL